MQNEINENLSLKERRRLERQDRERRFDRAEKWRLLSFPLAALGSNTFMLLMMLVAYFATGIVGISTVIASMLITGTRVFDAILDPLMGYIIDRTNWRFGKVRIYIAMGWVLMSLSTLLMFFTTQLVPESFSVFYFSLLYLIYIVGYTLYAMSTRTGTTVLTNDPLQRPVFGGAEAIYMTVFSAGFSIFLSNILAPKYGGLNSEGLFQELALWAVGLSLLFSIAGIIAISKRDKPENFETGSAEVIKFKDMWPILKNNRPLQMFIIAATTDKLGMQIQGNQIVNVMLFGIVLNNYAMLGIMNSVTIIPTILILLIGMRYASKVGNKRGVVISSWFALIVSTMMVLFLWLGDNQAIGTDNWGIMTIGFMVLYVLVHGSRMLATAFVPPMIPDIVDYEAYTNKRTVPGMISSIYTFIDKIVSSLQQTIVGLLLAMIGFTTVFPDIDTPLTQDLFWVTMFLGFGMTILAFIATLIAMKFYKLDKITMDKISDELENIRTEKKKKNQNEQNNDNLFNQL